MLTAFLLLSKGGFRGPASDWEIFSNGKFLCLLQKENEEDRVSGEMLTSKAFPGAIFPSPACGSMNVKLDGQAVGIK